MKGLRPKRLRVWLPVWAVLAVVVVSNLVAFRHPYRVDLTSTGVYSISEETRRAIASLQAPVEIVFFYDVRSKAMMDARFLLEQYAGESDRISVRTIDPQLQPAEARRYNVRFAGTSIFESQGRRVVVSGGAETDFTNGLIRATMQARQSVCFTDGHLESDPFSLKAHDHFEADMGTSHSHSTGGRPLEVYERHGIGMAKDALETLGYVVRKVVLASGPGQLKDCSVVVAASPQRAFLPIEVEELRRYLTLEGRAVLMLEPYVDSGLAALLAEFGIGVEGGSVMDEKAHYWTDPATPAITEFPRHKITRDLPLCFFPGALSLVPAPGGPVAGVKIIPLAETSDQAWTHDIEAQTPEAKRMGPRTLLLEAIRKKAADEETDSPTKTTRLIVIGDGDFATNSYYHILGNGALFLNVVNTLAGEEWLVNIQPKNYQLTRIRLTNQQMFATFLISTATLPAILIVIGGIVWWRKR